jgi:hypothetical protein
MALQDGCGSQSRYASTHDNDMMLFLGWLEGELFKCAIHCGGHCSDRGCWRLDSCNYFVLILTMVYFV